MYLWWCHRDCLTPSTVKHTSCHWNLLPVLNEFQGLGEWFRFIDQLLAFPAQNFFFMTFALLSRHPWHECLSQLLKNRCTHDHKKRNLSRHSYISALQSMFSLCVPWSGKQAVDERVLLVFPVEDKDVLWIEREERRKKYRKRGRGDREINHELIQS